MKKFATALVLFAFSLPLGTALAAAPDNDSVSNATEIAVAPFTATQDTTDATVEPGENLTGCEPVTHTVWYRYTPQQYETLIVNTFGSDYDTVLAVFSSTAPGSSPFACNDEANETHQSEVNLNLYAGETIYIQVGGWTNASGSLQINVTHGSSIAGRITDLDGNPLRDICIDAGNDEGSPNGYGWAYSSQDGSYLMQGLDPGHYRVSFYDCSSGKWQGEFYNDKEYWQDADVVSVDPESAVTGIDAALAPLSARVAPDLSLDNLTVTNVPVHTDGKTLPIGWVREVTVTWSNAGAVDSDYADLYVMACSKTFGGCQDIGGSYGQGMKAGTSAKMTFEWNGATNVGDVDIIASVCAGDETTYDNNARSVSSYSYVGGTGFGASAPGTGGYPGCGVF